MSFVGLTSAHAIFMETMNNILCRFLEIFIVLIEDIIIYSYKEEKHGCHLSLMLEILRTKRKKAKIDNYELGFEKWIV
jgi:hypothetical protein